jgi:hypothetical protein
MTSPEPSSTVDDAVARALAAYDALTGLGEEIDDEWSYVNDLANAWRDRLDEVAAARSGVALSPEADTAIDRAIDEIGRIRDPHRAIDWLSTFPQVTLLALGETP